MDHDNLVRINNYMNSTNSTNQFDSIEWIMDTTPDYNLTEDSEITYSISNIDNILVRTIQPIRNTSVTSFSLSDSDEFIAFDSHSLKRPSIETEVREFIVSDQEKNCCICFETKNSEDISLINYGHKFCGHKFCGTCILDHISVNKSNSLCPLCREKISYITFQREIYQNNFQNLYKFI